MRNAAFLIERLALSPHQEGGWFRETLRVPSSGGGRDAITAILFLLDADQISHWHRVDAVECWFWHAGAPLALRIARGCEMTTTTLGDDIAAGQSPQAMVPAHAWQAAAPMGGWSLVSCTVAPAFEFAGFELAPPGWEPGDPDPAGATSPSGGRSAAAR